jgi:hypothetical protein
MSVETEFRAMLAAYAPLSALVGTRIAQNAVDAGEPLPVVVFSASHEPLEGLEGAGAAEQVTLVAECWAETAVTAAAVASAVQAACNAHDAAQTTKAVLVRSRQSLHDGELGLDGEALTIEWWVL